MRRAWEDSGPPQQQQVRGVRLPRAGLTPTSVIYGEGSSRPRPASAARGKGSVSFCPGVGSATANSTSTPQLGWAAGSAYVGNFAKPVLMSALPIQYHMAKSLPPSHSLPALTGGGPGSPSSEASATDAMRAELVELRRKERGYVAEVQRLQGLLGSEDGR